MSANAMARRRGELIDAANALLGALKSSTPFEFIRKILNPGYGTEAAEPLFDSVIFWAMTFHALWSFGLVAAVAGLAVRYQKQQQQQQQCPDVEANFLIAKIRRICIGHIVAWMIIFLAGGVVRVRITYFKCSSGPPPPRYPAYVPPPGWDTDLDAEARHARVSSLSSAAAAAFYSVGSKVGAPEDSSTGLIRAEGASRYHGRGATGPSTNPYKPPLQGQRQYSSGAAPTRVIPHRGTKEADSSYEPIRNSAYRPFIPSPGVSPNRSPRLAPQDQHSHQNRDAPSSSVVDPARSTIMGRKFSWDDGSDLSGGRRPSSSSRVTANSAAATTAATTSDRRSQDSRPSREIHGDARRYAAAAEGPPYRQVSVRAGVDDARTVASDLAERVSSERIRERQRSDMAVRNYPRPGATRQGPR